MKAAILAARRLRVEDDEDQFEKHFATAVSEAPANQGQPAKEVVPAPAPEAAAVPAEVQAPAVDAPAAQPVTLESLQGQMAELAQRERSASGRAAAFMRKNGELEDLIREMRTKLDQTAAPPVRAPAPVPAAVEEDVLTSAPDLDAAVRRRVQEVLDPLMKRVDETAGRVDAVGRETQSMKAVVDPLSEQQFKDTVAKTRSTLDKSFTPKWRDDVVSDDFFAWVEQQPKEIQQAHKFAVTAEDSAAVLARYYAVKGFPTPTPTPTPTPSLAATNQDRLRQAAGIAPRGNARGPAGPAADDFEGNFALAAAQAQARKAA